MDPSKIVPDDQIWDAIKEECARAAANEPLLAGFLHATVLSKADIEESLSYLLASKLDNSTLPALGLRDIFQQVLILFIHFEERVQRTVSKPHQTLHHVFIRMQGEVEVRQRFLQLEHTEELLVLQGLSDLRLDDIGDRKSVV